MHLRLRAELSHAGKDFLRRCSLSRQNKPPTADFVCAISVQHNLGRFQRLTSSENDKVTR
jgi:hypothetical protein